MKERTYHLLFPIQLFHLITSYITKYTAQTSADCGLWYMYVQDMANRIYVRIKVVPSLLEFVHCSGRCVDELLGGEINFRLKRFRP